MSGSRFAPEFSVLLDGMPIQSELRASVLSVRCQTGYEGLDEVEITLANQGQQEIVYTLARNDYKGRTQKIEADTESKVIVINQEREKTITQMRAQTQKEVEQTRATY